MSDISLKHKLVLVGFVVLAGGLLLGAGAAEDADEEVHETTITMLSTAIYQPAPRAFIEYVEENSDGRIVFEDFIMETLGSDTDVMEMVYHGEIDITTGQMDAGVSTYVSSVVALSHPFAFSDPDEFIEAVHPESPIFQEFQRIVREESGGNLHALNGKYASSRNTYSVPGPIRTPDDLVQHSIRIRVPESPLHLGLWEALGATPVGVPGEERYGALQTGIVNALEGGLGSAIDLGLTDYTQYTILTGHVMTGHFFIANADWYDSLPEDLQAVVDEGAKRAADVQNRDLPQADAEAIDAMRDMGIDVIELTEEERQQWVDIAFDFAEEIMEAENVNPAFLEMVLDFGN